MSDATQKKQIGNVAVEFGTVHDGDVSVRLTHAKGDVGALDQVCDSLGLYVPINHLDSADSRPAWDTSNRGRDPQITFRKICKKIAKLNL